MSWATFIGYQAVWFITVIGAGRGLGWPGVAAALVFCALLLLFSTHRGRDLRLLVAALLLGVAVDGTLAYCGWLLYAARSAALPPGGAPLWILSLWSAFALTVPRALGWLSGKYALGAAFGAIGGPLAYLGAARGWGAVTFVAPAWRAEALLAAGWALAMLALLRAGRAPEAGVAL